MSKQRTGAVLFTINLARLTKFYREVVGLRDRSAEPGYVVLENDSFRLTVHQIPEQYARDIVVTVPPAELESAAIKLSFPVGSIALAREAASQLGGGVYGPEREWVYEGTMVCDGWDSDGNVFQLFEVIA